MIGGKVNRITGTVATGAVLTLALLVGSLSVGVSDGTDVGALVGFFLLDFARLRFGYFETWCQIRLSS
jgi:hypothetical protein